MIGIFITIIGVTGSVIAFEHDIDRILNPTLLHATPASSKISADAAFAVFEANFKDVEDMPLRLSTQPDEPYSMQVGNQTEAFVNPYTGQLIGTRQHPTVLDLIHTMHRTLLMGDVGEIIVVVAAFALLWLVISGLYLWWPQKRITVNFSGSLRRVAFDWHNVSGIFSALFLFAAGTSGIVVYFDDVIAGTLNKATYSADPVRTAPSTPVSGVPPIGLTRAVAAAAAALPQATPIAVRKPANAQDSIYVALRFPEDLTTGGRSWANIDQYNGTPVNVENSRKAPAGTETIIQNRAIHTGDILGYPTKIVMSLACLLLIGQILSGYYMWWKKMRFKIPRPRKAAATGPID